MINGPRCRHPTPQEGFMKGNSWFLIAAMVFTASGASLAETLEGKPVAVKRLPPSAFQTLIPSEIKELRKMGCRVPQSFDASMPDNVAIGQFAQYGQKDK